MSCHMKEKWGISMSVKEKETVRDGKVMNVREYIDTLAVARAFEMSTSAAA